MGIEVSLPKGPAKRKAAGDIADAMKEPIPRASSHLLSNKKTLGTGLSGRDRLPR